MDCYEITVVGWDKYNEKRKDVKNPSWLRLNHDYPHSQSLFGLSAAERYVHTSIICLAGKKQSASVRFGAEWFCHWAGGCFDVETLRSAITKLAKSSDPAITIEKEPGFSNTSRARRGKTNKPPRTLRARDVDVTLHNGRTDITDETDPTRRDDLPADKTPPGAVGDSVVASPEKEKPPNPVWEVWTCYADGYERRYRARPAENPKNFAHCKQLIGRLGADAPEVAGFFLTHNDRLYVQGKHPLSLLIRDAERIHTEWQTGEKTTSLTAKSKELEANNVDAVREYLREQGEVT